jgi:hypothetical protein
VSSIGSNTRISWSCSTVSRTTIRSMRHTTTGAMKANATKPPPWIRSNTLPSTLREW